ncbi:MAG: hypothetical protein QOJ19_4788 [Acidimicrobiia bacterium]|jgi:hypothetical protein|nr:hypothetical protein [Acidimicrobiia bacterium]
MEPAKGWSMSASVTSGTIDEEFVRNWSSRYPLGDLERDLLERVGPTVAKRGYFTRADLLVVGRWKSTRVLSRLNSNSNSDEDIEDITRVALSAPNRLKHRILHLLAGVQTPVASALLTVWNADMFAVTDVRAMETLRAHGEFSGPDPRYTPYLALC